jgi:hypothetical protein
MVGTFKFGRFEFTAELAFERQAAHRGGKTGLNAVRNAAGGDHDVGMPLSGLWLRRYENMGPFNSEVQPGDFWR